MTISENIFTIFTGCTLVKQYRCIYKKKGVKHRVQSRVTAKIFIHILYSYTAVYSRFRTHFVLHFNVFWFLLNIIYMSWPHNNQYRSEELSRPYKRDVSIDGPVTAYIIINRYALTHNIRNGNQSYRGHLLRFYSVI